MSDTIDVVFSDVGGVVLSNGWDSDARRRVIAEFGLDWDQFDERHDFVVDRFETGRLDLDRYINFVVGQRRDDFRVGDFADAMFTASTPVDGGLELARDLAASDVRLVTLNNESRPLHEYRVDEFGLGEIYEAFFTSAYLGVKKPDDAIYRIALDVMNVRPERAVFIDDRELNLEPAAAMAVHTIHHISPDQTREQLAELGIAT